MAYLSDCGFELNSTTSLHEYVKFGTPTIVTTHPRTGTYEMRTVNPTAGASWGGGLVFSASNVNVVYAQWGFYFGVLPTADTTLGGLIESVGTQPLNVWYDSTNKKFQIKYNDFVSTLAGATGVLTTGQYYVVEVYFDKSAAGGSHIITARLDGVQFASATNLTITNGVNELRWGSNLQGDGAATMDVFYDDMLTCDNSGTKMNTWFNLSKVKVLKPAATGDVNTFGTQTGGTAGAGNNFTRVNEVTPDDVTTFNGSSTLNEEDLYKMDASGLNSYDPVTGVIVHARFRNSTADATGAAKLEIEKAPSGTIQQGTAIIPNTTTWNTDATASPRVAKLIAYTDPDAGTWAQPTLDTMQAGIKLTTAPGTAGRRIDLTKIWASVIYTVGTPPVVGGHRLSLLGAGS